jgi:hypothetical protein
MKIQDIMMMYRWALSQDFIMYNNNRFFGHMVDMSGSVVNTMIGPDPIASYTGTTYVFPGEQQQINGDVDFCIDSSMPYGGLAVVASQGAKLMCIVE